MPEVEVGPLSVQQDPLVPMEETAPGSRHIRRGRVLADDGEIRILLDQEPTDPEAQRSNEGLIEKWTHGEARKSVVPKIEPKIT